MCDSQKVIDLSIDFGLSIEGRELREKERVEKGEGGGKEGSCRGPFQVDVQPCSCCFVVLCKDCY